MWGGMWTHPSEKERQRANAVFREALFDNPKPFFRAGQSPRHPRANPNRRIRIRRVMSLASGLTSSLSGDSWSRRSWYSPPLEPELAP